MRQTAQKSLATKVCSERCSPEATRIPDKIPMDGEGKLNSLYRDISHGFWHILCISSIIPELLSSPTFLSKSILNWTFFHQLKPFFSFLILKYALTQPNIYWNVKKAHAKKENFNLDETESGLLSSLKFLNFLEPLKALPKLVEAVLND